MLAELDRGVMSQEIFRSTPFEKQVMIATLSKEVRPVCKKFMQDPMEVSDDEAKLTSRPPAALCQAQGYGWQEQETV